MTAPTVPIVTNELIAELETAANAATPGPWVKSGPGEVSSSDYEYEGETMCDHVSSGFGCGSSDPDDAAFVAIANPATILALLTERADLKQQLVAAIVDAERYRWLRDKANWVRGSAPQVVITDWSGSPVSISPRAYPQGETLDAAIDAARAIADT